MKKIIFLIFSAFLLNGCFQVVAFIGPAVTGASTGNITQSAISYAVNYGVKEKTGKTVIENVVDLTKAENKKKLSKNPENEKFKNSSIFKSYK